MEGAHDARPGHKRGGRDQVPQQADRRRARARLAPRPTSLPGTSTPRLRRATTRRYLRTRFVRFLVSLRKPPSTRTQDVYAFVPDLPLDQEWTDAKLYERYGLTEDEIAFIESQVAEHDDDCLDEVVATTATMSKTIEEILAPKPEPGRASTPTRSPTRRMRACSRSGRPRAT